MTTAAFIVVCFIGLLGFCCTVVLLAAVLMAKEADVESDRLVVLEGCAWREPTARKTKARLN